MSRDSTQHLSDVRMQAFLDGDLSRREVVRAEEHLSACARCSAELDGWRVLYDELGALPAARPLQGFHDRVMASVEVAEPAPLAARLRQRVAGLLAEQEHVPAEVLGELFDGVLPARQVARIQAHLDHCDRCGSEAVHTRNVFRALTRLDQFAPRVGFANKVMAGVELAPEPVPVAARAGALARRLVPKTREAWAALSGVAVTPAATVGLLVYALFTHPTFTVGSFLSFAWWQVSDAVAALWTAASGFALESLQASGMASLLGALGSAPLVLGAGLLIYFVACGLALRVLYRNLFASHPLDGRYANVSLS